MGQIIANLVLTPEYDRDTNQQHIVCHRLTKSDSKHMPFMYKVNTFIRTACVVIRSYNPTKNTTSHDIFSKF
ncbi:hypothetical protein L596_000927 [Steinernema carpocapsae]|uniref:Uncharacterized protein n=1 Tax=Steinernema carpocapsae TaxID=34508 RepID=A0A4U8ULV3_STECR|nr:hypothetical protein L596_000927 [Steinernema carpocapsae]